jgi:hypothetical protein
MKELEFPIYPAAAGPRLRWAAIFAGATIALAVIVSLNMLGVGLGVFPAAASAAAAPAAALGPAASWWTLGAGVGASGLGGWFSSRLSDCGRRADGVLYGLVTWGASTLASVYVPAFALGGGQWIAGSGTFVFSTVALQALAAAIGGVAGARLYLPVPITEYRRGHRERAAS